MAKEQQRVFIMRRDLAKGRQSQSRGSDCVLGARDLHSGLTTSLEVDRVKAVLFTLIDRGRMGTFMVLEELRWSTQSNA